MTVQRFTNLLRLSTPFSTVWKRNRLTFWTRRLQREFRQWARTLRYFRFYRTSQKHWDELKEISSNDARVFNFNQFNNQYAWYDLNHTMPSSAEKIAAEYFD